MLFAPNPAQSLTRTDGRERKISAWGSAARERQGRCEASRITTLVSGRSRGRGNRLRTTQKQSNLLTTINASKGT